MLWGGNTVVGARGEMADIEAEISPRFHLHKDQLARVKIFRPTCLKAALHAVSRQTSFV